jgi:DNA-binding IclR family transcriptional regulator
VARGSNGLSALARSISVLDAFTVEAPFLTLTEIAERAHLPVSTAHRLVTELVSHGLVERMPDRSFRLGNRLWEMGSRTPGALGLREIALPFLRVVQAKVRQHVQLLVRSDLDVLVIERLSNRDAVVNGTIVGGRIPLQHSCSGLVLLADAEPGTIERIVARGLEPRTPAGAQTETQLRAAVATVRRQGFADLSGWIHAGSRGIAVPVRGSADVVVGAICLVVPDDRSAPDEFVALLRQAADGVAEELLRSYLPPDHPQARRGGVYRPLVHSSEPSMEYFEHLA